jgi:predicted DNA binding protein
MIRNYPNELWKEIKFEERFAEDEHFFVSNYGRVYKTKNDKSTLVKVSVLNGYQVILVKIKDKGSKRRSLYLHKLMGETFLEKEDEQQFVIHLNYIKLDNKLENLKWVTRREKEIHQFKNPHYKTRPRFIPSTTKLTEGRVRLIKRKLFDPNRRTRLKMIAKQFGVTTMQLHRIKTGENWGHVTDY